MLTFSERFAELRYQWFAHTHVSAPEAQALAASCCGKRQLITTALSNLTPEKLFKAEVW
jgi:hypothetical protein